MITPRGRVVASGRLGETIESIRAVQLARRHDHVVRRRARRPVEPRGSRHGTDRRRGPRRGRAAPTNGSAPPSAADGSWHTYYLADGEVEGPRLDTNVCAYVATGVWHHFLATGDSGFLEELWPSVERAIDFVISWQRPGGELVWSVDPDGTPGQLWAADRFLLGLLQPPLRHRVRFASSAASAPTGSWRPDASATPSPTTGAASPPRTSSRWTGTTRCWSARSTGDTASKRIEERWAEFVIERRGVRCVSDRPWVTAAETAECAIALVALGRRDEAETLLGWARQHRWPDGSYSTGIVYPQQVELPGGRAFDLHGGRDRVGRGLHSHAQPRRSTVRRRVAPLWPRSRRRAGAGQPPEHAQAPGLRAVLLIELARAQRPLVDLERWAPAVCWVGEHIVNGKPAAVGNTWRPAQVKSAQAGASPWPPSMNTRPAVTFQRAAMVGESPTTAIARSSAPAASMALLQNGKVSMRPVSGLTRVVVVVLEARLVLLRAMVVVDAEDDSACCAQALSPGDPGGEVEGRPAAVRADFDDGGEARPRGARGHGRKRKALVVGHEALGRTCRLEQVLVSGPGTHRGQLI